MARREVIPGMGQPALVATVRRIPLASKGKRPWRPDLWPGYVWVPLVSTPGVLVAIIFVMAIRSMAN